MLQSVEFAAGPVRAQIGYRTGVVCRRMLLSHVLAAPEQRHSHSPTPGGRPYNEGISFIQDRQLLGR